MPRSYLTNQQEKWFCENFSSKTNQELADMLSVSIAKENEKQIASLEAVLKDVTHKTVVKSIQGELEWRKAFKGVTASYVKHLGKRLKCGRKDLELVSQTNSNKAKKTNIKKWLKIAKVVDDPATWLSTFRKREIRICRLLNKDDLKKFRNAIFYFNRNNSDASGIVFSSNHIVEANLLRVCSCPIDIDK